MVMVVAGIGNPYLITAAFVLLNATCKYFLPGIYLYTQEHLHVITIDVIKCMLKILLHTVVVAFVVFNLQKIVDITCSPFIVLCTSLIVYYLLLIISSQIIKINYLQALLKFRK